MRARQRPFHKGLIDGLAFVIFLAMVIVALQRSGLLRPETGSYVAIDGDSLRKGESEFRLHGIDAPEYHQRCSNRMGVEYPCGREAQRALARLVAGVELSCVVRETDRYGRGVADCRAGTLDINGALVRQGWAIAYRRDSRYGAEQSEARKAKRGIWQGDFENPETWREAHRGSLIGADLGD